MNFSKKNGIKSNQKENFLFFLFAFIIVYAFLYFLNAIFPTQSDDIGRNIGGIQAAVNSYKIWNGRFGELLLLAFGSYFATTPFYAFVNGFIGASVVMLAFASIFGHLPGKNMKDVSCLAVMIAFFMFDPVFSFGAVFYWAAGSFNYLWAWFFILLLTAPVSLYWRRKQFSKTENMLLLIFAIPVGVIAGWSSEFGIVLIVLWLASVMIAKVKKMKLPAWYIVGLCALTIGWIILYMCPGMRERAKLFGSSYHSLTSLIKLGPVGLIKQIFATFNNFDNRFYQQNFFFISLFLLLTTLFYKPSLKKFESTVLAIFVMLFCLRSMPKLFFVVSAIFICVMSAVVSRKENSFMSNLFIALCGILIAEFLFIGVTIQVAIPRRARFQCTLLNMGIIAINMMYCFDIFAQNKKVQKIATMCCVSASVLYAAFVGTECVKMRDKWNAMEKSIEAQKSNGIINVVVDKNTFNSNYRNYGDWGNPGENPDVWPNTTYAQYYGVETFVAK